MRQQRPLTRLVLFHNIFGPGASGGSAGQDNGLGFGVNLLGRRSAFMLSTVSWHTSSWSSLYLAWHKKRLEEHDLRLFLNAFITMLFRKLRAAPSGIDELFGLEGAAAVDCDYHYCGAAVATTHASTMIINFPSSSQSPERLELEMKGI